MQYCGVFDSYIAILFALISKVKWKFDYAPTVKPITWEQNGMKICTLHSGRA